MSNWHRMGYPPTRWIGWFLVLIASFDLCIAGMFLAFGSEALAGIQHCLFPPVTMIIGFGAVGLAGFRLVRLPMSNGPGEKYPEWLACTPWQSDRRLPFGPWHPILLDLVPLGMLGAMAVGHAWVANSLAFNGSFAWLAAVPAVVFVLVWTIGGYLSVHKTWAWSKPVLVLWLSGVFHLIKRASAHENPTSLVEGYFAISMVLASLLVWRKIDQMLHEFPDRYHGAAETVKNVEHANIGTYNVLAPGYRPVLGFGEAAQRYRSLPGAVLIAVIGFSCASLVFEGIIALWFAGLITLFLGLTGCGAFAANQEPNLGLAARWGRRQVLVPAYDRVAWIFFTVTGLGGAVIACGAVGLLSPSLAGPLAVGVALFVMLRMGRDREEWSLTAPCRYSLIKPRSAVS